MSDAEVVRFGSTINERTVSSGTALLGVDWRHFIGSRVGQDIVRLESSLPQTTSESVRTCGECYSRCGAPPTAATTTISYSDVWDDFAHIWGSSSMSDTTLPNCVRHAMPATDDGGVAASLRRLADTNESVHVPDAVKRPTIIVGQTSEPFCSSTTIVASQPQYHPSSCHTAQSSADIAVLSSWRFAGLDHSSNEPVERAALQGPRSDGDGRILPLPPKIAGLQLRPSKPPVVCRVAGSRSEVSSVAGGKPCRRKASIGSAKSGFDTEDSCADDEPKDMTTKGVRGGSSTAVRGGVIRPFHDDDDAKPDRRLVDDRSRFTYDLRDEYEMYVHRHLQTSSRSPENDARRVLPALSTKAAGTCPRVAFDMPRLLPIDMLTKYAELSPMSSTDLPNSVASWNLTTSTASTQQQWCMPRDVDTKQSAVDDLVGEVISDRQPSTSSSTTTRTRPKSTSTVRRRKSKLSGFQTSRVKDTHPGCTTIRYNRSVLRPEEDQQRKYFCPIAGSSLNCLFRSVLNPCVMDSIIRTSAFRLTIISIIHVNGIPVFSTLVV